MSTKTAGSSQAAWALLTEGVSSARIEAHRLRALISRTLKLIADSDAEEHLYQIAGDLIQAGPEQIEKLERHLDRTSYALSVLGEDTLRETLPLSDRKLVDEAVERASSLDHMRRSVAAKYLARKADLTPALGWPGGPCHVIDRIEQEVRQPALRESLIDDLEAGESLTNPEAAKVYTPEVEAGPANTKVKKIIITPHAQYRMDLRGITVPMIRATLDSFFKAYAVEKGKKSYLATQWEEDFMRQESITWVDKRLGLLIAFVFEKDTARIITTYWKGESDPRPPGEGGCNL